MSCTSITHNIIIELSWLLYSFLFPNVPLPLASLTHMLTSFFICIFQFVMLHTLHFLPCYDYITTTHRLYCFVDVFGNFVLWLTIVCIPITYFMVSNSDLS